MTTLQAIGVFAGLPAATLLLIAVPLYGRRWYRRLVHRPRAAASIEAEPGPTERRDDP